MNQALDTLNKYWGYTSFRPPQQEVIQSVLDNKDTLTLMPTGGGKSLCFQVPTLMRPGLCLVITPLIALMKDQVKQLNDLSIKAEAIYSGMSPREIDIKLDNCIYGNIKFLYLSPERLKSELFRSRVVKMNVQLLVVDEAHCISEWGYDFRPSYLTIAEIRLLLPDISILALTATATPEVKEDIVLQLNFKESAEFQISFARLNLSYQVEVTEDKPGRLIGLIKKVDGSSLVYVNTRKKCRTVTLALQREGLNVDYYHGGMSAKDRSSVQDRWLNDLTNTMVATNAFGMGINKPNVRLVVHYDMPDHLEGYYQEAGRAGRDGAASKAVLLYQQGDMEIIQERKENEYPDIGYLREIYQHLANYYQLALGSEMEYSVDFDLEQFSHKFQQKPLQVFHALKKLKLFGYLEITEDLFQPSQFRFTSDHKLVYEFQIANAGFDPLIKAMLRLHGGELFTHPVNINESRMARLLQWDPGQIRKMLQNLQDQGLGVYQPKKDQPQLLFTTPRQDAGKLVFEIKSYQERKSRELDKLQSVYNYVQNNRLCRSLQLLEYFGEISDNKCGVCDVCGVKPATGHQEISSDIKSELTRSPQTLYGLSTNLKNHDPLRVAQVVQEMLDQREVIYDPLGRLQIGDTMV
jgi:ATP-dependent DNA helicase RecQ